MSAMNPASSIATFLVGCIIALSLQVYFFSPIHSPNVLHFPPSSSAPSPNNYLQQVIKLGEGSVLEPEDVCVGKNGVVYAATRDGWIKKLYKDGSLENWKMVNTTGLLGIIEVKDSDYFVVCDTEEGLLKVSEDEVTVLTSEFNGSKIKFADEVVEGPDGSFYFSIPSTKFNNDYWYLDVLEAKPQGQLLRYDPSTKATSLAIDKLCFPNGVAVSQDQDYLLVCETWKCLKYWLEGDQKGKTEVFVDNLPGGPDNIHLAPDGSFWIALLQLTPRELEFVHKSKVAKHIIATFPTLVEIVKGTTKKAMVVNVNAQGQITKRFDDPEGKVVSFVTTALEYEDHLYLGGLNFNFVGKLSLNKT
ncbi:hypothetical protein V2J09_003215 [Rumex salicifolius]